MAEPTKEVAERDPDAVISDIESTRENLARTIDQITDRVAPANVLRRTLASIREEAAKPQVQLIAGGVVLAFATVIGIGIWRRHH
ncbi:MAG TPA: DUF3618 domain-containing protein [Streptosporangiaceae bacterium]|nr:DUF3618 domain-containing protein [Streptosporangiaceae bacterium]